MLILVAIPLIVIIAGSFSYYNNSLKSEIATHNIALVSTIKNSFDKIFNDGISQMNYTLQNKSIELYMYEDSIYNQKKYLSYNSLTEMIKMQTLTQSNLENYYVYAKKSNSVLCEKGIFPIENFYEQAYMEDSFKKLESDKRSIIKIDEKNKRVTLQNPFIINNKILGMVSIDIRLSSLRNVTDYNSQDEIFVISDDLVFYSNNESYLGNNISSIGKLKQYTTSNHEKVIVEKDKVIAIELSPNTGLTYVNISPIQQYAQKVYNVRIFLLLLVIALIIAMIIICFYISIKIFTPFDQIIKTFRNPSLINLTKDNNEIKYIVDTITKNKIASENSEKELENRLMLLKKAQAVALQSQINPHFFHNTLETINILAMNLTGGENPASKTIKSLSKLLRLSLENTDIIVPFGDEIEHCKTYIEIQKIRYGNKFEVIWKIPAEFLKVMMVKIVLQPLVENAIYHGIKSQLLNGTITVMAYQYEESICIEVSNTGKPLSQNELLDLNEMIKGDIIKENEHIGLSNVNQRLKLFFGEAYGLIIESDGVEVTTVRIIVPKNFIS